MPHLQSHSSPSPNLIASLRFRRPPLGRWRVRRLRRWRALAASDATQADSSRRTMRSLTPGNHRQLRSIFLLHDVSLWKSRSGATTRQGFRLEVQFIISSVRFISLFPCLEPCSHFFVGLCLHPRQVGARGRPAKTASQTAVAPDGTARSLKWASISSSNLQQDNLQVLIPPLS
jgi:hypothetical protein